MKLTKKQIQNRRQWADALMDSTKTKGKLRSNGSSRCCLGVMCETFYPKQFEMAVDVSGDDYSLPADINVFHPSLYRTFGMTYEEMYYLAALNDGVFDRNDGTLRYLELTHKEIGMYLYFTCEAMGTPY